MPTQQRRAQDQDDEEVVDATGRKHDSRGRFTGEDADDDDSGGNAQRANGRGGEQQREREQPKEPPAAKGRPAAGGQAQAAKRALSRAVRVLNEIEARIHELREELEEQQGRAGGGDDADDGRGRLKNPESDRRLKQNQNRGDRDD